MAIFAAILYQIKKNSRIPKISSFSRNEEVPKSERNLQKIKKNLSNSTKHTYYRKSINKKWSSSEKIDLYRFFFSTRSLLERIAQNSIFTAIFYTIRSRLKNLAPKLRAREKNLLIKCKHVIEERKKLYMIEELCGWALIASIWD